MSPMASLILGLFVALVTLLATYFYTFYFVFLLLDSCFFTLKFDITTVSSSTNNSYVLFLMDYGKNSSSDSHRILYILITPTPWKVPRSLSPYAVSGCGRYFCDWPPN